MYERSAVKHPVCVCIIDYKLIVTPIINCLMGGYIFRTVVVSELPVFCTYDNTAEATNSLDQVGNLSITVGRTGHYYLYRGPQKGNNGVESKQNCIF